MSLASNVKAAKRSKTRIGNALMTLLKKMPYEKISISRLCREAGVSRQTFYKNFETLDAIVDYKLHQIQRRYEKQDSLLENRRPRFADFYRYIQNNKEYALLLQRKLSHLFEKLVKDTYKNYLIVNEPVMTGNPFQEELAGYAAAIVVSLARKWVENGYQDSPEKIAFITEELIAEYVRIRERPVKESDILAENEKYSRQHLADILDNIPSGVCVLFMPDETHQEIKFANKQMMRMINPSMPVPEQVSPKLSKLRDGYYKNAFSGVHPDDLQTAIAAFRKGFNLKHFKLSPIRLMTSTGEYIWVALTVTLRENLPNGRLFYVSYSNVSHEVQLRQDLEEQDQRLREALNSADKANEAKSVFLSSMSHDLRTPLNGIIGYTELAIQEQDNAKKQAFLQKIQSSGNLLLDMINDTLDLSRIESGKLVLRLEAVDGKQFWEEIVTAMEPSAHVKNITLVKDTSTWPEQMVMVDRLQVKKILVNIISNAIKYTPDGGQIYVKVEVLEPPIKGCTRRITVEDTGIGMSREFMERMFEPFSQEHRSELLNVTGTGLGLAIVKRIVDFLGGNIMVESRLHKGTKFTIDFPLKAWEKNGNIEKQISIITKAVNETLANRRILLCEDNYLNAEIAQLLLKNKKMTVDWAKDGYEGINIFVDSAPGYYSMVLMDIRMPIVDGLQAAQAIRKLGRSDAKTIPIVAMTADAFEETIQAAEQAGMDAYITKPIVPATLYKTLFEQLKAEPQPVAVEGGLVQGVEENGLMVYRGIPFAAPPVGNLRWRPPQKVKPWDGVIKAKHFSAAPPQQVLNPVFASIDNSVGQQAEDCLYLNIWTPAVKQEERARKRPVMVWIHGGSFTMGAAFQANWTGEHLADKDVVYVTIPYRLGVLGFLAHPELSAESQRGVSGNYGLLDQIAGLQWIRDNIASFGGDPEKVTVFGESAGAIAVSMLCVSALAKGLFIRAISESGAFIGPVEKNSVCGNLTLKTAEEEGLALAKRLGVRSLEELRKVPAEQFVKDKRAQMGGFWPVVDGYVLAGDPCKLYQQGKFNDVDLLVGTNSNEGAMFFQTPVSKEEYAQFAKGFVPDTEEILDVYPGNTEAEALQSQRGIFQDYVFAWPAYTWAKLQCQNGKGKVYMYYFNESEPAHDTTFTLEGAAHSDEINYVFGHVEENINFHYTDKDRKLSQLIQGYWLNFARNGDPNGENLPHWPQYKEGTETVMYLNSTASKPGPIAQERRIKFWDKYLTKC